MKSGSKGIGSTKHGKSGHTVNSSHFTGRKSSLTAPRKRKKNERSKRVHINKYENK